MSADAGMDTFDWRASIAEIAAIGSIARPPLH